MTDSARRAWASHPFPVLGLATITGSIVASLVGDSVVYELPLIVSYFLSSLFVVGVAMVVRQGMSRGLLPDRPLRRVVFSLLVLLAGGITLLALEARFVRNLDFGGIPVAIVTSPWEVEGTAQHCVNLRTTDPEKLNECWDGREWIALWLTLSYLTTLAGIGMGAACFLVDPRRELPRAPPVNGYVDFQVRVDLVVDRTYRVTAQADGYSTASTTFELPEALGLFAPKKLGGALFETVFRGNVRSVLHGARRAARKSQQGIRIRLSLENAPKLAALPWELLYDRALDGFFALSPSSPIVRSLDRPEPCEALHVTPPLRVLVTVSQPPQLRSLETEKEWEHMQEALQPLIHQGLLVLERLTRGSWQALSERLWQTAPKQRVHVFHFIGHGGLVDEETSGALAFEGTGEKPDYVDGETLGKALEDHGIRLAVLNACHGARIPQKEPLAGVGQALLARGLPAVVAMQDAVSDNTAIEFARSFYDRLAQGRPVDEALSEVRSLLSGLHDHKHEWSTPVLYLHAQDGRLFDVQQTRRRGRLRRLGRWLRPRWGRSEESGE